MIIKKFLHSCILIEENGKRLLIDPGAFSFIEKKLKPEDIGGVDVILLTHKHLDHYDPDALRKLLTLKPANIVTHGEIGTLLAKEKLPCERIEAGESKNVEGFTIEAFSAPHEPIPAEIPYNLAFLINKKVFHPGDSFGISPLPHCEVLLLPIVAPWARLVDALEFAKKMKPRKVIPIHDAIMKDFMLERIYGMCAAYFGKQGVEFHPLALEEVLEI